MASLRGDFSALNGISDLIRQMREEDVHSSSELKNTKKKELLVFCLYIHVGSASTQRSLESLGNWEKIMKNFANEIETTSNYKVTYLILPQKESETRLECVFPKSQEEMDMSIFSTFNQLTEEKLLP